MNPLLLTDFYKVHHHRMYPQNTSMIMSNWTPRKSRKPGIDKVVVFGIQYFIKTYLIHMFRDDFFNRDLNEVVEEYKKYAQTDDVDHIIALHKLGYLPLEIKALDEGELCPIGVPCLTVHNTKPEFYWLTNYIESLMSCILWQPMTSATIAYEYRKLFTKWMEKTDPDKSWFIDWQGHDFSFRGMSGQQSAILSGMGHLLSFTGTDTIPAIFKLDQLYRSPDNYLIGASVPATEHSVMCMGTKDDEIGTFSRLLDLYPEGILSVVSDTWDLWKVCTEYLPTLKDKVLARNGKLVIRPDSGDPVDIICGTTEIKNKYTHSKEVEKGVVELLWDVFGGTVNDQGYKVLDPHIGVIYGDAITLERAEEICKRLEAKGFASTNWVAGIGSYTYQYNTRDVFGFAMKATYGELTHPAPHEGGTGYIEPREIFKDPITSDGEKKSAKGMLRVVKVNGTYQLEQGVDFTTFSSNNELKTVFLDGAVIRPTSLKDIRERLHGK